MKAFIPSKLAEVIFALVIAYFGYWHFKTADSMGKTVPHYIPGPGSLWIYLTGSGFLLAAIGILTEIRKTLACYLLAAMLLAFVFIIHIKSFDSNPFAALKDVAIAMCALIIGNNKK
ncbi:MAG: DoxX family protein [Bacteroidota bacterium]|nr:DoxX family protein [Bacteroidota bacterium]